MISGKAFAYSLGNLGTNIFSQSFATYVLFFYVDHLRASLGLISLVMGLQAIWHAMLNPILGQLSDATRSRFGRRMPYVAGAALPLGVTYWMIWRPYVHRAHLPLYFAVVVTAFDLLYLTVVLNWTSLFPELYRTLAERTRVQAWRQGIGVIALMVGVSAPPLIYRRWGWHTMGLLLALVGTAGFLAALFGPKERSRPQLPASQARPRPIQAIWQTAADMAFVRYLTMNFLIQFIFSLIPATLPFFAKYVMHVKGSGLTLLLASIFVVALATMYPWARYIYRVGSHRAMVTTIGLLALGVLPFWWLTKMGTALAAGVVLGLGLAGFLSLADLLIAEVIDADAERRGRRREGSFYGFNGFVVRFGVTLESLVVYLVFHWTGYHANAAGHATKLVQWGMRCLLGGVPLLALTVALWAIMTFKVRESPRTPSQPIS